MLKLSISSCSPVVHHPSKTYWKILLDRSTAPKMKFVVLFCATLVASLAITSALPQIPFLGGSNNLSPLPALIPSGGLNYWTVFNTIGSIHSQLSNTPLRPFLPSVTDLVTGALRVSSAATSIQDAIRRANEFVSTTIRQAAERANFSPDFINQMTSQVQSLVTQGLQSQGSSSSSTTTTQPSG